MLTPAALQGGSTKAQTLRETQAQLDLRAAGDGGAGSQGNPKQDMHASVLCCALMITE